MKFNRKYLIVSIVFLLIFLILIAFGFDPIKSKNSNRSNQDALAAVTLVVSLTSLIISITKLEKTKPTAYEILYKAAHECFHVFDYQQNGDYRSEDIEETIKNMKSMEFKLDEVDEEFKNDWMFFFQRITFYKEKYEDLVQDKFQSQRLYVSGDKNQESLNDKSREMWLKYRSELFDQIMLLKGRKPQQSKQIIHSEVKRRI